MNDDVEAGSGEYRPGQSVFPHHALLRSAGASDIAITESDAQYRALGRVHYEFSRLIWWLRYYVRHRIDLKIGGEGPFVAERRVLKSLISDTAGRSVTSVFELCAELFAHSNEDMAIAERLRAEFKSINQRRNHLTHGDVLLAFGVPEEWRSSPQSATEPPLQMSVSRTGVDGDINLIESLSSAVGLEGFANEVTFHRKRSTEYVRTCLLLAPLNFGAERPSQILHIRNERVERIIPYAPDREVMILP